MCLASTTVHSRQCLEQTYPFVLLKINNFLPRVGDLLRVRS